MARLFVTGINLNKNELQNARIQNLSSAPSSPVAGQVYYNTSDNIMYFYNGSTWISTSGSLEVIQDAIGAYVVGGTALTATYDDNAGTTTIDLDNTSVSSGSYGTTAAKTVSFTVDAQGRLTAASEQDIQIATSQVTGLSEYIDDTVGDAVSGLVKEGEGIDVAYDDAAGTLTISGEDASSSNKGIASFDSTDFTVTSGAVTLNAERVEDIAANLIVAGTGLDKTYNDGAGTLTIDIDSTVTTNSGAQTLTNKTLGSSTTLGANLDANTYKITNLGTPTASGDAVNKSYVDGLTAGLDWKAAVNLLSDSNISDLTDFTTITIDGHVVDVDQIGYRILLKGQTTDSENGIYNVVAATGSNITLSRSSDADAYGELTGAAVFVMEGTNYGATSWIQSNHYLTDFSGQVWTQSSGAGTYLAGAGLTLSGNTFSADVTPTSGNPSLTNTGGAIEVKVNTTDGLEVTTNGLGINNGTGLTFSAGALTFDTSNGYGTRKKAYSIGDGSATSYTVNHALSTRDVTVQIFDNASPYAQVEADVEHTDSNNVTVKFATAPTTDQYRVVVIG